MFASRNFSGWRGLPSTCTLSETLQTFAPQDDWIGEGQLGREAIATNYRYCHAPSYDSPVRVWFQNEQVVELEGQELADAESAQALSGQLGEPAARLEAYLGVVRVENGEWVYPERGIAFRTDSSGERVTRLFVFAPTDLEDYRRRLRVNTRSIPVPAPDEK